MYRLALDDSNIELVYMSENVQRILHYAKQLHYNTQLLKQVYTSNDILYMWDVWQVLLKSRQMLPWCLDYPTY